MTSFFIAHTRIFAAAIVVCVAWLPASLQGQVPGWQSSGSNIYVQPGMNVGIGTTSPTYPLDISGTSITALRINGTAGIATSNNTQLRFAGGTSGELWAIGTDVAANNGSKNFHFYALPTAGNIVAMTLQSTTGNVGIGTTAPQYKLSVNGTIGAKEVVVTNTGWADYVFKPGYRPKPLSEVAIYIREHHRLPDIPSEKEVREKGVSLGDMQVKLLAKIEELTLHMIRADERNNRMEQENRELRERIARLEAAQSKPETTNEKSN